MNITDIEPYLNGLNVSVSGLNETMQTVVSQNTEIQYTVYLFLVVAWLYMLFRLTWVRRG